MRSISRGLYVIGLALVWVMGCDEIGGGGATITDTSSPYYDRPCPLSQHAEYPSDLIADCRCGPNQAPRDGIPVCRRPFDAAKDGLRVGEGPSVATLFNVEYLGGFLDESDGERGVIYVSFGHGPSTEQSGGVMRVDLATGDRTLVTGVAAGGVSRGEGPELGYVYDVKRTSDGKLLAFASDTENKETLLYEVDPESGDRVDLQIEECRRSWEDPDSGIVFNAFMKRERGGFALDEEDRFYVGYGGTDAGQGIIRYDLTLPVEEQCDIVTNSTDVAMIRRGEGPGLGGFVRNIFFKDGELYGMSRATKTFFKVDPETGDREHLHQITGVTPAEQWAWWDDGRGVWWLGGMSNGISIHAWDPATGTSAHIFQGGVHGFMPLGASGPIQINALNHSPFWFHSNGNLYVAQDGQSIVEFEPATGNSVILSL